MTAYRGPEYHRAYRARRLAAGGFEHGSDDSYVNHGCRCDDCRRAHRDARRIERTRHSRMTWQAAERVTHE